MNEEQPIHLLYGFLYVADKYEGLVIVGHVQLRGEYLYAAIGEGGVPRL